MKLKKHLIILTLITLSFFAPKVFSAEPVLSVILPTSNFYDIPDNHWAYTEIKELHRRGIIVGYPDDKFHPDASITREEFATVAVKALGLDDAEVLDPLAFDDFYPMDWAWHYVQNAYYFGLLTPPRMDKNGEYLFRPTENIIRGHAITIAINALKTQPISKKKAKAVLEYAYDDFYKVPDWFLQSAAKAQLLDMLVINPTKTTRLIDYDKPITRAETAVLIYNMIEEAKTNPNAKIKKAMDKKRVAEGHILTEAYIEDETIAVIPTGTILTLMLTRDFSSQNAVVGEKYTALVPKNFIHGKKYLILPSGAKFNGHIQKAQKGRFLIRNGILTFENDTLEVLHQPALKVEAKANITTPKTNSRFRRIFKGEKLHIDRGQFLELELLQDLRVDVTNGKLIKSQDL